jgi:hypothetical protein
MNTQNATINRAEVAKSKAVTAMDSAKAALAKGFDTKSGQKNAMETLRRAADTIKQAYHSAYLSIAKEATKNQNDFYWDFPDLHVWKEKNVAAANAAHPELSELAALMTELAALRNELKAAPVVKAPSKAEQRAAVLETTARKGNVEVMTDALQQVLADVIQSNAEMAQRQIDSIKATLIEKAMNMKTAYPESADQRVPAMITESTGHSLSGYFTRKFSAENEQKYIKRCKEEAQGSFNAFIEKMAMKLGDKSIVAITCDGRIWNYCTVVVKCDDGTTTTLRTQIIVNVSKLGNLFNQWPTRTTIS